MTSLFMIPFKDDQSLVRKAFYQQTTKVHDIGRDDMGRKTLRIYLYLYLFLLDFSPIYLLWTLATIYDSISLSRGRESMEAKY